MTDRPRETAIIKKLPGNLFSPPETSVYLSSNTVPDRDGTKTSHTVYSAPDPDIPEPAIFQNTPEPGTCRVDAGKPQPEQIIRGKANGRGTNRGNPGNRQGVLIKNASFSNLIY